MSMTDVEMLFKFIGGVGMFLYGIQIMTDGLMESTGEKMKGILERLAGNKLLGVLMGTLVTAVIQSSTAVTVMVVGFVNAGIMDLTQAACAIMGANIGTTVTAWIVSMNEWGSVLDPEFYAPLCIGVGTFLYLFSKGKKIREAGIILSGFGILFVGIGFMTSSMAPYRDAPIFYQLFSALGKNPVFGILAGAIVTAIIQSSSASVTILQTMAMNGMVNWSSAVYLTLGQNVGTCTTALLAGAGGNRNAKCAAIIHLMFNVLGAVVFGVVMFLIFSIDTGWRDSMVSSVEISMFHTVLNIVSTVLMYPFISWLVNLSEKMVPHKI